MKEYITSFFNAPVTNKIPTCICSVAGLHTYISTNPQLEELTRKVRAGLGDKQVFRKNKQTLLPYVTPAGIFSYCKEQCMQVPSGLFVIDIDELAVVVGKMLADENCRNVDKHTVVKAAFIKSLLPFAKRLVSGGTIANIRAQINNMLASK